MPLAEYLAAALQLGSLINTDGYAPWGFLGVVVRMAAFYAVTGIGAGLFLWGVWREITNP